MNLVTVRDPVIVVRKCSAECVSNIYIYMCVCVCMYVYIQGDQKVSVYLMIVL